jgi:arsenate reductase
MDKRVTIYHNPRCTKSRETLALLRDRGIDPVIVEYLETPPPKGRLRELARMLGDGKKLLRTKEPLCKELGLSAESTVAEVIDAIAEHPVLLERPLVVCGTRAAIGRPPESVLDIVP